jgi:HPt (histidine-containing phosphotransfer) domain-containing protein/CheY-like chemotaxis protein
MNTLRVLVVNSDTQEAERLAARLADAQHMALPAAGLDEAVEALFVQKFDAVLLGSPLPSQGISEFTAKLRSLERGQRNATPTAVFSVSSELPNGAEWCTGDKGVERTGIDAYLANSFQPATLVEALSGLSAAIHAAGEAPKSQTSEALLFDVEQFREQVGYDEHLMRELIDLFVAESPCQAVEMRDSLAAGDFERLARVAHTIKGSFAAFHAEQARMHAQQLETAAKAADAGQCRDLLSTLEQDLELLEPRLASLRNGASGR